MPLFPTWGFFPLCSPLTMSPSKKRNRAREGSGHCILEWRSYTYFGQPATESWKETSPHYLPHSLPSALKKWSGLYGLQPPEETPTPSLGIVWRSLERLKWWSDFNKMNLSGNKCTIFHLGPKQNETATREDSKRPSSLKLHLTFPSEAFMNFLTKTPMETQIRVKIHNVENKDWWMA